MAYEWRPLAGPIEKVNGRRWPGRLGYPRTETAKPRPVAQYPTDWQPADDNFSGLDHHRSSSLIG
ncbi:hypothetical protein [Spirosoma pollinicola]|uniref:hypothetical protein n=1 Tax=Spirosoma pollinicola TaxID=2057025 RepID=UPI0012FD2C42|nr:hypothetical protein [Spirosoma pollinicola]